jgi:flagellar biosynthesis protein FlhG
MSSASPATPAAPAVPLRRNVIAIASGKGGVGKTWVAITLAHALARLGRRTLLFDGDLGLANVDVQLGITPRRDLGAVVAGQLTLPQAASRFADGGFDILAGRSGSGSLGTLPLARLAALRQELHAMAQEYDWAVLDLGAGLERSVRVLALQARACLVVTTDEPTSLTDAYAFIKVTRRDTLTDDIRVVVNMAASRSEGEKTYATIRRACREFLHFEPALAGIVRRDERVRDSIRRQTALLTRHPNSDAAADVEAIARALAAG